MWEGGSEARDIYSERERERLRERERRDRGGGREGGREREREIHGREQGVGSQWGAAGTAGPAGTIRLRQKRIMYIYNAVYISMYVCIYVFMYNKDG